MLLSLEFLKVCYFARNFVVVTPAAAAATDDVVGCCVNVFGNFQLVILLFLT